MHILVYGAGSVGSVVGGLLSLARNDVHLVCREPHAAAIANDGLRLRSATGEYVAHPRATSTVSRDDFRDDTMVLLTVKSHDTEACAREIAGLAGDSVPVCCLQNGVANEETASRHLTRVYGGICRMTSSVLQPGAASFRRPGRVIVGRYPKGTDALSRKLSEALIEAGLESAVSRNIMSDRWLKLAVNTQSVFHAVIDPRDHDANEFNELKARILLETGVILKSAGIRLRSCDGRDPSIDAMIEELRRPRARRAAHGINVHNSVWQDLYRRRDRLESEFIHGPLIALADEHDADATINRVALDLATRAQSAAGGPETLRLADVLGEIDGTVS